MRPMGVVSSVDEDGGGRADPLQPSWAGHRGEGVAHRVDVQRRVRARTEEHLSSGQRERGVSGLMRAVQWEKDLVVHSAETLQLQLLTADGDVALQHTELNALTCPRRVNPDAAA